MKIKLVLKYVSPKKEKIKIKIKTHINTMYTTSSIELDYLNYDMGGGNIKLSDVNKPNKPNLSLINSLPKIS
tara:strand:+ start:741 stop:956 length:216 start_codon:yes stop_codon:yes gene_type:complete